MCTDRTTSGSPPTRREARVEVLHGQRVSDPYRWLEASPDDPELLQWVRTQAQAAHEHLDALPARHWFRDALEGLWRHPRRGVPWRRGDRWFQMANDGHQEQDVLWTATVTDGSAGDLPAPDTWDVLLDPAAWSAEGTSALAALAVTEDGQRVAFARSEAGSDWMTWRVVDAATGRLHPDEVPWSKFSPAAWLPDGSGFLYSGYEAPETTGATHAARNRGQQLRRHQLGSDARSDRVVHASTDDPDRGFVPHISHDGRWLVITVTRGTQPETRIHVAPITDGGDIGAVTALLDAEDASYQPVGVLDDEVILVTDHGADLGRIVAVHLRTATLRELVGAGPDRLLDAHLLGGDRPGEPARLLVHRLHDATSSVTVHDAVDGAPLGDVSLPGPGSVTAIAASRHMGTAHLAVESFTQPPAILRIDPFDLPTARIHPSGGRPVPARVVSPPADAAPPPDLVVEQVAVRHAGVAVPLFLIHRRDVEPDGRVPTVLWGYGGFDIPVTPMYRPGWRAWVEAGGLLAVACLRGGGEYGRTWHDAGRRADKHHVFDDALACAAWLCGRRTDEVDAVPLEAAAPATRPADPGGNCWTSPGHLGIEGRSNGGLLAAACAVREPTAFGSVVPEVGVLDMARFHLFTIGWAWTSDYGSPDDPDDLAVLLEYSPYHRVQPGRSYPPTLITTGDTDDRVVPAHSYKFAAALQHAQGGDAPVLLRVDIAAGHGAGKPVHKALDERADVLAFHAHHLGLQPVGFDTGAGAAPGAGSG